MLEELLRELPVRLAVWALPFLIGAVVFYGRKFAQKAVVEIEQRIGDRQWSLLQEMARRAVQAAEQVTGIDTNEEKKQFALDVLSTMARQFNIPVERATLDVVIEGVLKIAKAEMEQPFPTATLEVTEF